MDEIPEDIKNSLAAVEKCFTRLHEPPVGSSDNLESLKEGMVPIDKAVLDLTSSYAVQSLFWMYLQIAKEDKLAETIREGLSCVQRNMKKVSELKDKKLAPKLDIDASKRFIKHSLYDKNTSKKRKADQDGDRKEENGKSSKLDS